MEEIREGIEIERLRYKLTKACRLLSKMGVVAHAEGNVSAKISEKLFLIKVSSTPFRGIQPEDFILVNDKGESLSEKEPSTEKFLHIEVYKQIPETIFVIHTHPSYVIKISSMPMEFLEIPMESHAFRILGKIPMIGPFPAGSLELAKAAAATLRKAKGKAVVLKNHGLVVISKSLEEAFDLTIFIEKAAHEKLLNLLK